jgi:hypothetical protein
MAAIGLDRNPESNLFFGFMASFKKPDPELLPSVARAASNAKHGC